MYGVVHGGVEKDLRKHSLDYITSLPFDGFCIGGSLGGSRREMVEMLGDVMRDYNEIQGSWDRTKPVHLLGIADESSILETVHMGIDTFDSCYPTRLARHGTILTKGGKVHIKSRKHQREYGIPLDKDCNCTTCQQVDRAYLNHLYKAKEPTFYQYAIVHNVSYMNKLMEDVREKILNDEI